ncbi:hypothetical protein ABTL50_19230, partial [Acinetobacter baumannii]
MRLKAEIEEINSLACKLGEGLSEEERIKYDGLLYELAETLSNRNHIEEKDANTAFERVAHEVWHRKWNLLERWVTNPHLMMSDEI